MSTGRLNRRRWLQLTALAAAGAMAGAGKRSAASSRIQARVAIVGGGFAGSACALQLRTLSADIDITLIDPVEHYSTCPMSNEVIVGLRALQSIAVSRVGLQRAGIRLVPERVLGIDAQARRLRFKDGRSLSFDRLVIAPGIRFLWDRIEGYDQDASQRMPHAWQAGEQTAILARQLRDMPDGGVLAISVPAGLLRCPPGPYERASLIAHYLRAHKPRCKILILDANNSFPKQPLFTDAWRRLYRDIIEWVPMTEDGTVVRVDSRKMILYTSAAEHKVAVANIIPPQAPSELAPAAGLASDHGWCPIEPRSFESTQVPYVHVIGDACIADAMPKSASAAYSQARQCAAALAALLSGREVPPPLLESVCYSTLAPGLAIAFPGQFQIIDGRIVAAAATAPAATQLSFDSEAAAREARAAERWYALIRRQAFAS